MAILKPAEMDFSGKNIIMIISGLPGVGKTTLALSAPDVLLIDCDEGMSRVKPEHRRDSSICTTYQEILADIKAAEGNYKTIVIDTGGSLIDKMKDWAMATDKKATKSSGGISQQGFGIVKTEFLRLSAELRKKFNVIFLFHEAKSKDGDEIFYDILCEGSAKTLVWQPADLGAHLAIINDQRCLCFSPTANYNAKSAYGIRGIVKVPELADGDKNDFLTRLFETVRQNLAVESATLNAEEAAYHETMTAGMDVIGHIQKPEDVNEALKVIATLGHALTSQKELKAAIKTKMESLGIVYNKDKKIYEYAEA